MANGAPRGRLATIARGAVALGAVAVLDVVFQVWRAWDLNREYADLRGWRAPFGDGASFSAAFVALGAVVLALLLPTSPRYSHRRRVAVLLCGLASVINMALEIGRLSIIRSGPRQISMGTFYGELKGALPAGALSAIVLLMAVDVLRWSRTTPDEPQEGPSPPVLTDEAYLEGER